MSYSSKELFRFFKDRLMGAMVLDELNFCGLLTFYFLLGVAN